MNILFHSNQISERGTEIALFDYAAGNQKVLQNNSFVAISRERIFDTNVLERFRQNFNIHLYESKEDLKSFIEKNKIDLIYRIIYGKDKEEPLHDSIPHLNHCVFSLNAEDGTFYCPISPFLNRWFRKSYPVLPHIVKQFSGNTKSLRPDLGIPHDAVVFGGYGAEYNFNIPFVHKTIIDIASKRKDIYFLFMNFKPFIDKGAELQNVIFLPKNTDINYKETFIFCAVFRIDCWRWTT